MDIYIQNACFLVARTCGKIILVDDMRSKVKKKKVKIPEIDLYLHT